MPNSARIRGDLLHGDYGERVRDVQGCTRRYNELFSRYLDVRRLHGRPVAALENMRIIKDEGLLEKTVAMGERCLSNLENLMHKHSVIGDVRGKRLFLGAELVSDRATKVPLTEKLVQAAVAKCMSEGVIIGATNRSLYGLNNILCLSPALIATADDIDRITFAGLLPVYRTRG